MSADLLRRAAAKLRDPLLCNWDRETALALAEWLDAVQIQAFEHQIPVWLSQPFALAHAGLREEGDPR